MSDKCDCGRPPGQCVKGDLEYCDADDAADEDEFDPGEECGRWNNGRLGKQCRLAGTEWCDWECPYSR